MAQISITHDLDKLKAELTRIEREQIPFATSKAINAVARRAKERMPSIFASALDRPKPFTTNSSIFVTFSNKSNLQATVGLKDKQASYLAPLLAGRSRAQKPIEQRFMGRFFVPGGGAPLDSYGNVSKANLVAIAEAAKTGGDWKGKRIMVLDRPRGKLPAGVYSTERKRGAKRGAGGLVLLLVFVNGAPSYRQKIRFAEEVNTVVRSQFASEFANAMASAVGSTE